MQSLPVIPASRFGGQCRFIPCVSVLPDLPGHAPTSLRDLRPGRQVRRCSLGATPTPQRTPESGPVGEMNSLTSSKWRSLRFRFGPFRLAWRHHAPRAARASTDFAKSSGLSKGLFGYPHTCDICQQVLHKSVKPSPTFSPALFLVILPSRCSDLGSRDLGLGCPARFRCT